MRINDIEDIFEYTIVYIYLHMYCKVTVKC